MTILAFGNPQFPNFKHVAVEYLNTQNYFISADCSFKVSERPSKIAVNVQAVIAVSAQCPPSHRLCWHRVCVVNDFVSA